MTGKEYEEGLRIIFAFFVGNCEKISGEPETYRIRFLDSFSESVTLTRDELIDCINEHLSTEKGILKGQSELINSILTYGEVKDLGRLGETSYKQYETFLMKMRGKNDYEKTLALAKEVSTHLKQFLVQLLYEIFLLEKRFKEMNVDTTFLQKNLIFIGHLLGSSKGTFYNVVLDNLLCYGRTDYYQVVQDSIGTKEDFDNSFIVNFILNNISQEQFISFIKYRGIEVMDKKEIIDAIIDSGKFFESKSEFYSCFEPADLVSMLFDDNQPVDPILLSNIGEEVLLQAMVDEKGRPKFHSDKTERIWDLYEQGRFSLDGLKFMKKLKYISTEHIIELYNTRNNRKIAAELGDVQPLSDEKIMEYFDPGRVIREINKNPNKTCKTFFKETLPEIYEANGNNLRTLLVEAIKSKSKNDESTYANTIIKLYEDGYIDINALTYAELPEIKMEDLWRSHSGSVSELTSLFNNGLINQDFILDNFELDQVVDMISNGMSARAISGGYYSTSELIDLIKPQVVIDENDSEKTITIPGKLKAEQLKDLKDEICIGVDENGTLSNNNDDSKSLLELYANDEVSLATLYELVQAGIINSDQFETIKDNYDIKGKWNQLKEQGIFGNPAGGLGNTLNTSNQSSQALPVAQKTIGIDDDRIWDLYVEMGATDYLEIDSEKCPVFKGYSLIPIFSKHNHLFNEDIAYLESSDGRTYILPLKIVLEQINNPDGDLNLVGNAVGRNDFNSNKEHVRSVNHSRNWAWNMLMKTADLPIVKCTPKEARKIIINNMPIMEAVRKCNESYDYRKTH